jgi:DNA helicase-2/ATP-dependent DNA helicase PcrA
MNVSTHRPANAGIVPEGIPAGRPHAPVSLETVRPLLRGLNREQRRAVTHGDGPLLVVAGPGTGKTEVITRRIAWLIATKRAHPSEILALTFTDKAADEMQARVDLLVPYGRADAAIHTFHAFGDRLLREFGFELGRTNAPRVISRAEGVVLLREHLFELGLDRYLPLADPTRFLGALTGLISRAKDEGVAAAEYAAFAAELRAGAEAVLSAASEPGEREVGEAIAQEAAGHAEVAAAYRRYEELLAERGLVDFGDQVALALRLLEERPAVRAEVHRRYRYLLVDEFQDTNPVQLDFVRALAGERSNVTVVGDDDQAIYTFRGAAVENILGFGASFPALRRVVLRRNYRSRPPILAAAERLIRHNAPHRLDGRDGVDKTLIADRGARKPLAVRYVGYRTASEEADGVAATIARRVVSGQAPSSFAILVRTNADAEAFLRSLDHLGVPWRFSGASDLYARREVRDLLAFLRTVANPDSSVDLYAVASGDPYRLQGEDLTTLLEAGRRRHRSFWSVCTELVEQPGLLRLGPDSRAAIERLVADIRDAVAASHAVPAGDVLYRHLKRSGRLAALIASAERGDDAALRNVARFFEIVRGQAALLQEDRLPFLVPHLGTLIEAGDDPADAGADDPGDAVSVLTIHKAKGLEFPVVFLVGLADGRFPVRGRRDRLPLPDALRRTPLAAEEAPWSEERRLCYVAMTRARDELLLSGSSESASGRRRRPSPFIAEALDRVPAAGREGDARDETVGRLVAMLVPPSPVHDSPDGAPAPAHGAVELPLSLSYSQLDDYLSCPLRYRLRHVVHVPTPPHHALVLGNALHQAVAAFHSVRMRGRTMGEAELLEVFRTHWSSEGFFSREHEEARYASGEGSLRRFLAEQLRDGASQPVAVERPFSVRLGRDTVRGRYDRLDETPAGTVITDYKSSDVRDPKKAAEKARDSLQLQLYALAHQAETGELPAAVELHFLESGLTGRVIPEPARLDKARGVLERAAEGIRAGRFEARPDYVSCGYCPFRDICPSSAA